MLLLRLPIVAAIIMSALARRRSSSWGPILIALTIALGNDLIGERLQLPPREDLALWLLTPAISAWCAWTVLGRARWWVAAISCAFAWALFATWVLRAPLPRLWWPWAPPVALCCSIAGQCAAVGAWLDRGDLGGSAEVAAVGLLGGDLFLLLGTGGLLPGPWWAAAAQSSLVSFLLVAYQIRTEIALRRARPEADR